MTDYAFRAHSALTDAGWRQAARRSSRGTTRYEHPDRPGHKVIVDPHTDNVNHYKDNRLVNSHSMSRSEPKEMARKIATENEAFADVRKKTGQYSAREFRDWNK